MTDEVFISYSHEDASRIQPIVDLIRTLKAGSVFQDSRSIQAGKEWEPQLLSALQRASCVVVFWCEHSATSEYVKKEYERAVSDRKDVLPLLLDDTELPSPLAAYQWIDLRGSYVHGRLMHFARDLFFGSKTHYYPRDKHGEYRDWRGEHWRQLQREFLISDRNSAAARIVAALDLRSSSADKGG